MPQNELKVKFVEAYGCKSFRVEDYEFNIHTIVAPCKYIEAEPGDPNAVDFIKDWMEYIAVKAQGAMYNIDMKFSPSVQRRHFDSPLYWNDACLAVTTVQTDNGCTISGIWPMKMEINPYSYRVTVYFSYELICDPDGTIVIECERNS